MSEADTVPEDVRKLAGDTAMRYNSQGNRSRGIDERLSLAEYVARAIMADRNRRAPIAEGMGQRVTVEYDGFAGTIIGEYTTREGKHGWVVQQDGTRVVHVYGENRVSIAASTKEG